MGNIHEPQAGVDVTKVPTEGQTQTLRRDSDPNTPLRIRIVDSDGRNEEEAPDNATADDEGDHTDTRKKCKSHAVAHAVCVEDTEPHDPDSELVDDTTEPRRRQHPLLRRNLRRQSRRRAGTMCRPHNESNAQSGRFVSNKRNHVVYPQAELDSVVFGKDVGQTPRRSLDQACLQLEPRPGKRVEADLTTYLQPDKSNRDKKRSHERHDLARHGRQLERGCCGK